MNWDHILEWEKYWEYEKMVKKSLIRIESYYYLYQECTYILIEEAILND